MKMDILLATYNGEKYVDHLIESLLTQSHSQFSILIRDDGSTDKTIEIIRDYEQMHKGKIKIIRDNLGNLGSSRCFIELLMHTEADYIMLCDQDDVWLPNKIEITLEMMERLEKMHNKETPILVFTDLKVVKNDLDIVSESFWKYQKLDPEISKDWVALLASNVITGCTIMLNRKAKEVVLPFRLPKMIHDHWLGVNISRYGIVDYISIQTILYKQHGENIIGASEYNARYFIKKIANGKNIINIIKINYNFSKYFKVSFCKILFLKLKINLSRLLK